MYKKNKNSNNNNNANDAFTHTELQCKSLDWHTAYTWQSKNQN